MEKSEYFHEMEITGDYVKPIMKKYVLHLMRDHKDLCKQINYLCSRRLGKDALLLKPLFVRLSYEMCGGREWKKIAPMCAAAELINISSYQSNLSFDGKHKVMSEIDKNNQFIASIVTREAVHDIIRDTVKTVGNDKAERISWCFAESNRQIYVGQYYDLNVFVKESYDIHNDFQVFLKGYLKRCLWLSGIFSQQCALVGGILADANKEYLSELGSFGRNFGTGLHVINDLGDFVPSNLIRSNSLRKPYDQCSDLKQGKLTLPVMYVLKFGNIRERKNMTELLGCPNISEEDVEKVVEILHGAGAVAFTRHIAKNFWRSAKKSLEKFPACKARFLLSIMLSQLRTNKYLYALRQNMYKAVGKV